MEQYGFFVNTDLCIGCKACMTACFDRNNLEVPNKFRKVYEFGGGDWSKGVSGGYDTTAFGYYASLTCGHCNLPACMAACPTGAISKNPETNIVSINAELCNGCMTCREACPYNHPVQLPDKLAHKCVLCADTMADGCVDKDPKPACATACPVRALTFGPIDDLRFEHSENNRAIGTLSESTNPNVAISLHRDAPKAGDLLNPCEVGNVA